MSAPQQDEKSDLLLVNNAAAAPPARRSVSFGPASTSPPPPSNSGNSVGIKTFLEQNNAGFTPTSSSNTTASGTSYGNATGKADGTSNAGMASAAAVQRRIASDASAAGGSNEPGSSAGGVTGLKPALKQGTERKRLPPIGHYQHPDPLIRRLRLVDDKGNAVNLKDFFKGVKIVAFYFSSQWAGQPLKEYHSTISEFAREHQREFKVIYVSVDVDEQWYKAGVKGQPWVSMVWNDGSSLPSPSATNATSPTADQANDTPAPLYNNEDFLLAQETDIDESLSKTDTAGEAYLRPFSRVHLASKLNIIAAPTVCVYNLERQKMLDWNVRMSRLHRNERDETWARWSRGESAKSFGFTEALQNSPGTVLLAAFALAYWILIISGGQDFNFLRRAIDALDPSKSSSSTADVTSAAKSTGAAVAQGVRDAFQEAREHVEF